MFPCGYLGSISGGSKSSKVADWKNVINTTKIKLWQIWGLGQVAKWPSLKAECDIYHKHKLRYSPVSVATCYVQTIISQQNNLQDAN